LSQTVFIEPTASSVHASSPHGRFPYLALVLIFTLVYFVSLFPPALLDDADSTHAEAAREMFVSGNYVTLQVNGIRYLEKAPLPYWLAAVGYRIFGVNEFAAHLPNVLAVLLLGVLGLVWGRWAFGERGGIYAALFLFTCTGMYLFTRIFIPDALLSLLISAALYFFLTALEPGERRWRWYAGYASVALAVLAKGLVALVFVGVTAILFVAITGDWRRWREFRLFTGLLLLFAIAAPWHILAGLRNPRFFWFYFVNEHVLRFLGKRYPRDYNKLPATLYWTLHLVWLFPWSFYLPVLLAGVRARRTSVAKAPPSSGPIGPAGAFPAVGLAGAARLGSQTAVEASPVPPRDPDARPLRLGRVEKDGHFLGPVAESDSSRFAARTRLLCWLLAGFVLVFFAISTNQEYYTLPAYLPLFLLLADGLVRREAVETAASGGQWLWMSTAALAVIGVLGSVALFAGLWLSRKLPFVPDIGELLARHNLSTDTLSMSHMLDLSWQSFAALRLPAVLAGATLIVASVLSLVLRWRGRHYAATWTWGWGMAVVLLAAFIAFGRFSPYLSSKQLATAIAARAGPQDKILIYGDQSFGSSLLFYLRRPVALVNGRSSSMWFGSTYPDAPRIFLSDADVLEEWAGHGRVFLFVPPHLNAKVEALLPRRFVIAQASGKTVYSNQP